jgi:isocitrate dehydrogenase
MGDIFSKIENLPTEKKAEIEADIKAEFAKRPELAMVDSDKGITNLHVPSDVIIDASMPAMIRSSGKMWGPDGKLHDCKAMIPDRSYARIYQEVISFCQKNGAFDPKTMGNVSNVGLMAKKAEEYGSHDKTFKISEHGSVRVVNSSGEVVFEHNVSEGDIWRMCQTKDVAIKDWVRLAVSRARATGQPAVFWLDKDRAHDASLIAKVETYLPEHDTNGLEVKIMAPVEAMRFTLDRVHKGQDTISVTGNVLRDYLTDLFPILELGTSAKMLSIVPLLAGGGLYETGAGGSAPKHVQQFVEEGHLRWDSLGEFLALAVSIEDLGQKTGNNNAVVLSECLSVATSKILNNGKSPSRKVKELDNRGSHFFLAQYWAEALASQTKIASLSERFSKAAKELKDKEKQILEELDAAQGSAVELGGYFRPDEEKLVKAMRPSQTLNQIIEGV